MKKIVVILTACLLILGASLSIAAQVTEPIAANTYDDLDFRGSSSKNATEQMGEVLDRVEGVEMSAQEKNFIRYAYEGQHVLYYTRPSLNDLDYEYDGGDKRLIVTVAEDLYKPKKHDAFVVWQPMTVTIGDVTCDFAPASDLGEGMYRAVFENLEWSAELTATIEYGAELEITAATLNDFVNFAYQNSLVLHDEYASLEARLDAYRVALQAYEQNRDQWLQYENECDRYDLHLAKSAMYKDYVAYQNYLSQLGVYESQHQAFLENQQAWARYEQDSLKYAQYVQYRDVEYPALRTTVDNQLQLLALMEKPDPNTGISFMDMMIDDRIAGMIEEKRTLVSALVGEGPVDAVVESTQKLQSFCLTYRSLTTDQEKYAFYIQEYNRVKKVPGGTQSDGLVKHLRQLYTNIKTLYENDTIYNELQRSYPEHIATLVRMLGSLYVQRCMFDDTVTFNPNEIVDKRGNQKATALVHQSVRPTSDTNKATPLSAWPKDPETYEITKQPQQPSERLVDGVCPSKPVFEYVSHEDELDPYMEDPGYMAEPTPPAGEKLPHPGAEPSLSWTVTQQELHEAYLEGLICERPTFTENQKTVICASNNVTISLSAAERCYYVHFYNTGDQETYLGHSVGVTYGEAAVIPEQWRSLERAPELAYTYEFIGWLDANGDPLDLSSMTEDVYAYASYRALPRTYTVTWVAGGKTTTEQWEYGTTPVFEGSTDIPTDERYEYVFNGWDKQIGAVVGDVTYTAQYERVDRRYTVTFDMGGGADPIRKEYLYEQSLAEVVAAMAKPYMPPTAQYSYTFVGWKDAAGNLYTENNQLPLLTSDMSFTAVFESRVNSYTVTWMVDGVAVQTTWLYGQTPAYGENASIVPTKEMDERYTYTFAAWDREITPVTGDAEYTAQFEANIRLYRVDFVVEGKTTTLELAYEQLPVFDGEPQKTSDVQYDYTFIGWDREPTPVREDAIYIAEFSKTVRKYPVTFVVGESATTAEFEYGSLPKYPGTTPAKADDANYRYEFAGWDAEVVAVDGSAVTYTATFRAVPIALGADGTMGQLTVGSDGRFELHIAGSQVDLSYVVQKAGEAQAEELRVFLGEAILILPKAQIDAFYLMGNGIGNVILAAEQHEGRAAYRFEMYDGTGVPVAYLVSELTLCLPYNGVHTADVYRLASDGSQSALQVVHKDGYLQVSTMEQATFVLRDKYLITQEPTVNGVFDVIKEAHAGEVVTLMIDPDEGYHVDTVTVTCNGQAIKVEIVDGKYSFVMPAGNVQVNTSFKVVEGGTAIEVIVGVLTALLIVAVGFIIAIVLRRRRSVKV